MPPPFPGMNPYLEGYLWADVHNALASKIRQILVPQLRPRYTARLEIYLVEDPAPEAEIGILYPDVEVLRVRQSETAGLGRLAVLGSAIATTPATLTLPILAPVEIRIPVIEIRATASNVLVTSIEILSPVNKREPGLSSYRQKQQRLRQSQVHLVEIDLLRRGIRPMSYPRLQEVPYVVMLTRAQASAVEVWTMPLWERLPILPIPLRSPDLDAALDLQQAMNEIYDEAGYDLSIDYTQMPPPPLLSEKDQQKLKEYLA
jgi:Protein of unknown function (DUF4058)